MMYLLDTDVISETVKSSPNSNVLSWLSEIESRSFALSVLTIGEIRIGVEKLEDVARRQKIIQWLEIDLIKQFQSRIIDINAEIADKWGYIYSKFKILPIDSLIAASAIVHNLKLVTRNTKDFCAISGLEIINPWESTNNSIN